MNDTSSKQKGSVLVGLWHTVNISAVIDGWLGDDCAIHRIQFNLEKHKSYLKIETKNTRCLYYLKICIWPHNQLIFSPGFVLIVLQCFLYDTTHQTLNYHREQRWFSFVTVTFLREMIKQMRHVWGFLLHLRVQMWMVKSWQTSNILLLPLHTEWQRVLF